MLFSVGSLNNINMCPALLDFASRYAYFGDTLLIALSAQCDDRKLQVTDIETDEINTTLAVGVSSCLLGNRVRFDGGHKHNRYITEVLGKVFTFVPVCPEVETGMGVPRETIDLHGTVEAPHLVGNETGADHTTMMNRYAARRVKQRDLAPVCGFILKSKSPTCGLQKVRLFGSSGRVSYRATGLFAMALSRRYPSLPLIEERLLHDADTRDNFITRVLAYNRVQLDLMQRPSVSKIRRFHERERLLLDAHSVKLRRALDKLLASSCDFTPTVFAELYRGLFMRALAVRSTPAKNARVMRSVLHRIERAIPSKPTRKLAQLIAKYRDGRIGLLEPLSLLRHYVELLEIPELVNQSYLNADDRETGLRFGKYG